MTDNNFNIIGYIHICKKGEWLRSLNMLVESIKKSNLFTNTQQIRVGILYDTLEDKELGDLTLSDDEEFNKKVEIVYLGLATEYERPTLLHMLKSSFIDPPNTRYYYLHTKGLRHFGKPSEQNVIDWINLMLFWNITKWKHALDTLKTYDTYGCNSLRVHYSGNFWWATSNYVKTSIYTKWHKLMSIKLFGIPNDKIGCKKCSFFLTKFMNQMNTSIYITNNKPTKQTKLANLSHYINKF